MDKSKEQKNLEEGLKETSKKKTHRNIPKETHKLTSTQEQMLMSKNKYDTKMKITELYLELEKTKHQNILEEIKEMKEAKITSFNR